MKNLQLIVFIINIFSAFLSYSGIKAADEEIPNKYFSINHGEEIVFAHISDEHIKPSETTNIDRLTSGLKTIKGSGVPLLISTGDLTDDNREESYLQYRKILSSVGGYSYYKGPTAGIAFKPVAGNHDYWGITPFPAYLGPPQHSYILGNYRFIGFSGNPNSSLPLDWLEGEMKKSLIDGRRIVVYHHYPPYGWPSGMLKEPWLKLSGLFQKYPVIAYLSGHNHVDQVGILHPDIFAHSSGRKPAGYWTLYALTHGNINWHVKPSGITPTIITFPYQYHEGVDFSKTAAGITKIRAYATTTEQSIKRVYYQIGSNPPVTMNRIGTSPYYEAPLDARNLKGLFTIKVVAEHSYGQWANGTHQITCYFETTFPNITQLSPNFGEPGDPIYIYGSHLGTAQGMGVVRFGNEIATVTGWSDTRIQVTVPSGSGAVSVTVTTPEGTSNPLSFEYRPAMPPSLISLIPSYGQAGDLIGIHGSHFGATQGTGIVKFGGVNATVTAWTDRLIQAKAPAGSGTVPVTVMTGEGVSNAIPFVYRASPAPSISSLSPANGKPGTLVAINGANFGSTQGAGGVKFGSATAAIISWGNTTIQVKAPSGSGTASVTVNTAAGTSNGVQFVYDPLPNLVPYRPSGWSDKIVVSKIAGTTVDSNEFFSTDTLYVDWAVANNGSVPVDTRFCAKLYVDNVARAVWWKDPPLRVWYDWRVLDYSIGKLSAGTHRIMILFDCSNVVPEVNESDNTYTKTITVK